MRETERERQRQRQRETQRETERERDRETEKAQCAHTRAETESNTIVDAGPLNNFVDLIISQGSNLTLGGKASPSLPWQLRKL